MTAQTVRHDRLAWRRLGRLSRWLHAGLVAGVMSLAGCGGTTKVADNPVVGPRPPRISDRMMSQLEGDSIDRSSSATGQSRVDLSDESGSGGVVRTASASSDVAFLDSLVQPAAGSSIELHETDVAARVNGKPIFVSEVIERYRPRLVELRSQASPAQYQQMQRELVRKELPDHVEQALVIHAARGQFKQAQWDELQDKLDGFFYEEEVPSLQKRVEVSSLRELEFKLQGAGTTLSAYRRVWGERQIAGQWIADKIPTITVSRQELLAEYEQQRESYREPEQMKWQECIILNDRHGGSEGSKQRLNLAIDALRAGESFDQVVATYSDGIRAADGGHWDWTRPDSLSDDRLRSTLSSLKLEQIGPVIEDSRGYRLVKLTGYRPERVVPFEEVQKELRASVSQRKREVEAKKILEELKAKAHITYHPSLGEDRL